MTKKSLHKILPLVLVAVFLSAPLTTHAAFVPCGTGDVNNNGTVDPGEEPCQFRHLVVLVIRVINYLMAFAGVVAMYYVLLSGFSLITALGNPERIEKAKNGLSNAVVGFAMIALSFVFVNLVVNGILGSVGTRNWYDPNCLQNLTSTPGCALGN